MGRTFGLPCEWIAPVVFCLANYMYINDYFDSLNYLLT